MVVCLCGIPKQRTRSCLNFSLKVTVQMRFCIISRLPFAEPGLSSGSYGLQRAEV